MKKDRSDNSMSQGQDFGLPRAKILRGRKNIQRLFHDDAVLLHEKSVQLRFRLFNAPPDTEAGCRMGFVAGKKLGKAVRRNRVKRLLREAYRMNQHILTSIVGHDSVIFHGILIANRTEMDFSTVQEEVASLLVRAKEYVIPIKEPGS